MIDDDLRELERRARASSDPADCLAAAEALRRAGRADDVLDVLRPAAAEPAVRAELAKMPAWTHQDGDAGATRWLDVPPIRSMPRLRWTHRARSMSAISGGLLAGPLGVAVPGHSGTILDPGTLLATVVLDPDTGEERSRLRGLPILIADGGVVRGSFPIRSLSSGDLLDGGELWSIGIGPPSLGHLTIGHVESRLIVSVTRATEGHVEIFDWPDPMQRPRRTARFEELSLPGDPVRRGLQDERPILPDPSCFAVVVGSELDGDRHGVLIDAASNEARWTFAGVPVAGDGDDLLILGRSGHRLRALDGATRWVASRQIGPATRILASDWVQIGGDERGRLILDRATGELRAAISGREATSLEAAARNVIYGYDEASRPASITAVTSDGELLWRFPLEDELVGELIALVPASGRIYGANRGRVVFCLEES